MDFKKMNFVFSQRSLNSLKGVHSDLVNVAKRAIEITPVDFIVIEGLRDKARQIELKNSGKSQTLESRHLTGHAIDIAAYVSGQVTWEAHYYPIIAQAIKEAAKDFNIPLVWGGDWKTFKDLGHFELNKNFYP